MDCFLVLFVSFATLSFVSAGDVVLTPEAYADTMSVDAILEHLKVFQSYADASANTRAHGSPGYTASAEYVYGIAQDAGLDVQRQGVASPVGFVRGGTLSVEGVTFQAPNVTADFFTNTTAPEGLTTDLVSIAGYGCDQDEFANTANKTVLLKAGQCEVSTKSFNALVSSVPAIIIYDETPLPPTPGAGVFASPRGDIVVPVVLSASYDVGQILLGKLASKSLSVTVNVQIEIQNISSDNVIAQTKWGDQEKVPAGPGINDNGSGSATLAELIKQLVQFDGAKYALRFAWWSSEELGLLGSEYYVDQLTQSERDKIVAYINIDMSASPNYILAIQDNDNSGGQRPPWIPTPPVGSNAIEKILQGVYESMGSNFTGFAIAENSDHASFMTNGIPMGALETGAGGLKTDLEAQLFGGVAGKSYDSCYHSSCDDINNLSHEALILNARAVARALAILANDVSAIEAEQAKASSGARVEFKGASHPMSDLGRHSH
ncbi:Peptide hydrolase [Mycena venus]|uniref:Peptide hydrolase n=1 Tax=Mycena venus TaxID=2733690 RepID=A0A8H6XVM7_9AGAR|nr:Peptide hydrolase [Mycena venus]